MKLNPVFVVFRLTLAVIWLCGTSPQASDWPRFRGPNGSEVTDAHNLPVDFGPTRNVVWKDGAVDAAEWNRALGLTQGGNNSFLAVDVGGINGRTDQSPAGKIKWRVTKFLTDSSSVLLYQDVLYLVKSGGDIDDDRSRDRRDIETGTIEGCAR